MSINVLAWALNKAPKQFPELSQGARHLLIYIADHFNEDEGAAWPSVVRLSDLMGVSERSVQNWIKELVDASILSRHMRVNQTTLYRFIVPTRGERGAPGGAGDSPGGERGAPLGVNDVHPNSYKHLKNKTARDANDKPVNYWELDEIPISEETQRLLDELKKKL